MKKSINKTSSNLVLFCSEKYKTIGLKKYVSDTGKILPSRITSVCQNKQRKLNVAIKRAQVLGLI